MSRWSPSVIRQPVESPLVGLRSGIERGTSRGFDLLDRQNRLEQQDIENRRATEADRRSEAYLRLQQAYQDSSERARSLSEAEQGLGPEGVHGPYTVHTPYGDIEPERSAPARTAAYQEKVTSARQRDVTDALMRARPDMNPDAADIAVRDPAAYRAVYGAPTNMDEWREQEKIKQQNTLEQIRLRGQVGSEGVLAQERADKMRADYAERTVRATWNPNEDAQRNAFRAMMIAQDDPTAQKLGMAKTHYQAAAQELRTPKPGTMRQPSASDITVEELFGGGRTGGSPAPAGRGAGSGTATPAAAPAGPTMPRAQPTAVAPQPQADPLLSQYNAALQRIDANVRAGRTNPQEAARQKAEADSILRANGRRP